MKYFFLGTLLLLGNFVLGQDEETENYVWSYSSMSGNISEKTQLVFAEKLHYNVTRGQFDYNQSDLILYRKLHKNFSIGMAIRNAHAGRNGNRVSEITPQLYGVYKANPKNIGIIWSNRFGYRNFDTGDKQVRYRNKLTLISPLSYTKLRIRPYVAEEMFIKLNQDGFYNLRLFGGLYLFDIRFLKVNLFYCYNMIESDDVWKHQNVAALNLYFQI